MFSIAWASGCTRSTPLERSGFSLKVPHGFQSSPVKNHPVPGRPLAAWKGPSGSALIVYKTLPVPDVSPASYVVALANRLENLPGVQVVSQDVDKIAGLDAARVYAVAPGDGGSFAPSGTGTPVSLSGKELIPTRLLTLAFLRPADTLCVAFYCPEAEYKSLRPAWEAIRKSMTLEGGSLETSSY
jgi:hypothetical protein